MSKKKELEHKDPEIKVENALGKTEMFLAHHKNTLLYVLIGIVGVAAIIFGYEKLYKEPLKKEAHAQMFTAEQYFRTDSFALALNGDGNAWGFNQIIDEYGSKAGKVVYFYAGVCQLQTGQYREAIENLKKYDAKDEITAARALGCIGDAYVELNELPEAANYFVKAANYRDNAYAPKYLLKAGLVYEELGKTDEAIKVYQQIKDHYAQTTEGREIDKYIARLNPTL